MSTPVKLSTFVLSIFDISESNVGQKYCSEEEEEGTEKLEDVEDDELIVFTEGKLHLVVVEGLREPLGDFLLVGEEERKCWETQTGPAG